MAKDKGADRPIHPLAGKSDTVFTPEDVNHKVEKAIVRKGSYVLNKQTWTPHGKTVGIVILLHGLNTHVGFSFATWDYKYKGSIIESYVKNQIKVVGIDQQSFGKSKGWMKKKALFKKADELAKDVAALVTSYAAEDRMVPVFIHGQCFGGLVAIKTTRFLNQQDLRGLILTVPNIKIAPDAVPSDAVVGLLGVFSTFCPALPLVPMPDDGDESARRYLDDPNCYSGPVRARVCYELARSYNEMESTLENITSPFIIIQAEKDSYCDPEGSRRLFDQAKSTDKTLYMVTNMGHAIISEPGCEQIWAIIRNWMNPRIAQVTGITKKEETITVTKPAAERLSVGATMFVELARQKFMSSTRRTKRLTKLVSTFHG